MFSAFCYFWFDVIFGKASANLFICEKIACTKDFINSGVDIHLWCILKPFFLFCFLFSESSDERELEF